MIKKLLLTTVFLISAAAPAHATNLVLACGGYTTQGLPPKVGIYDISTNPATEKWSATTTGGHDIYDACEVVNNGKQVLVSAYYNAYLINISDGSIAETYNTVFSHQLVPLNNKKLLASVSHQNPYAGGVQIYDYENPPTKLTDEPNILPWTHAFLPVPGSNYTYYVGWQNGISVMSIPSLVSPNPDVNIGKLYPAPTQLVHAMIYKPDGNILLSTNNDVYTFDIKNKTYTPFFSTVKRHVKTLSYNTDTGEYLYNTEDDDTVSGAGQPKLVHFTPATDGTQRADVTLPQAAYSVKWVYQDSNGVYSTKD